MQEAVVLLDREARRHANGKRGQPLSDADQQALIDGFAAGASTGDLAVQLGRSELAIRSRLVKHGLVDPEVITGALPNTQPRAFGAASA